MASSPLCAACRPVFRLQFGRSGRSPEFYGARTTPSATRNGPRLFFSTSRLLSASQATPQNSQATPKKSQATSREYQSKPTPVNPGPGEDPKAVPSIGEEESGAAYTDTPTRKIAKEFSKQFPSVTETYRAYAICERLVKECAQQADYTIPQARERNVEIPKTKDQEDLGVGTGWWFESERISLPCSRL